MNPKKTALLALLLVVGGLWAWYGEHRPAIEKREREAAEKKLFAFKPDSVDGLTISTGGAKIEIVKKGTAWKITAPVETDGDNETISAMINAAANAESAEFLSGPEKGYGLSPAGASIVFRHGDSSDTLDVGLASPTGALTYVRSSKQERPSAVGASLGGDLSKNLFQLRSKKIAAFEPSAVSAVEIAVAGKPTAALLKKDGKWAFAPPDARRVDQDAVAEFINRLKNAAATGFADDKGDAEAGLAPPRLVITLRGNEKETLLLFGAETEDRLGVYARGADSPAIATIPGGLMMELPLSADALRERRIFTLKREDVKKVSIERGGEKMEFVLNAGIWQYAEKGKAVRADDVKMGELVDSLLAMRAKEFTAAPAGTKKTAPDILLTLNGETSVSFHKSPGKALALYGSNAALLDETAIRPLDVAPSSFADRRIFKIRQRDVESVTIERGTIKIALVKKGGLWLSAGDGGKRADLFKTGKLVSGLCALSFVQSLDGGAETGEPLAVITLAGGGQSSGASFLRHNGDKTLLLVKPAGEGALYVARADEALSLLPDTLEDLL